MFTNGENKRSGQLSMDGKMEGLTPLLDEDFPAALGVLIKDYTGVDTLQEHFDTDSNDKKFDRLYLTRRYQYALEVDLPKLWEAEILDLQSTLMTFREAKEEVSGVDEHAASLEQKTPNAANYQALLQRNQKKLEEEIVKYLEGKSNQDVSVIMSSVTHYCRFKPNKSGIMLTLAIFAARKDDTQRKNALNDIIDRLLDGGAATNPVASTSFLSVPLNSAAMRGSPRVVEFLLKVDPANSRKYYLKIFSSFMDLDSEIVGEWSPFLMACVFNSVEVVEKFLEAAPNEMQSAMALLKLWLEKSKDRNNTRFVIDIKRTGLDGLLFNYEPTSLSVNHIRLAIFKMLLACSNLNKRVGKNFSVESKDDSIIRLGFIHYIREAKNVKALDELYDAIINHSELLSSKGMRFLVGWMSPLKIEFVNLWRNKAFDMLQSKQQELLGKREFDRHKTNLLINEIRLVLAHPAFSPEYEKGGVLSEHRNRLENMLAGLRDNELTYKDQAAVVTVIQKRR